MESKIKFINILICLFNFTSVLTADKACPYKPIDIVFVLDGSGSEGEANFRKQLQFVSNFTEQFEIGPDQTRVSLLTFATRPYNQFYLNELTNKTKVLDRINATAYPNGETNTHAALNYVHYTTLNPFYGGERNVTKLVVVLTDGRSLEPDMLKLAATNLKNYPSVTVVAIGIGQNVDYTELLTIGSDRNHTFLVQSFDVLHTLQGELTDVACNACNNLFSDVCFVLDSSGSEGAVNFNKQLEFVQMVINEFALENSSQTRACIITFSTKAVTEINLGQYSDKESLISNVIKIPYRDGETRTDLGLFAARAALHSGTADKVAIVLTDGRSTEPQFTAQAATAIHRAGIDVFAVGIGNNVDPNELDIIASDHDHVLKVNSFDHLAEIHESLVAKLCNITPASASTTTVPTVISTMTAPTTKLFTPIPDTSTMAPVISTNGLFTTERVVTTTKHLTDTTSNLKETTTHSDKLSTKPLTTNTPTISTEAPKTTAKLSTSTILTTRSETTKTHSNTLSTQPLTTSSSSNAPETSAKPQTSTTHAETVPTQPLTTNNPMFSASSMSTKPPETTTLTKRPDVSATSITLISSTITLTTGTTVLPVVSATSVKTTTTTNSR